MQAPRHIERQTSLGILRGGRHPWGHPCPQIILNSHRARTWVVTNDWAVWERATATANQGGNMKKLFALVVLSVCMAVPSFAGDVVGRNVKGVGKEGGKDLAIPAKETGKAAL